MKPKILGLVVVLVVLGAGGFAYLLWWGESTDLSEKENTTPARAATAEPETPKVRYPIPQNTAGAQTSTVKPMVSAEAAKLDSTPPPMPDPLPALDTSDPEVAEEVGALVGLDSLERLFNVDNLVRRIVVTVDNLPRRQVPPRYIPTAPIAGKFQARGEEGQQTLSAKNYQRYIAYVRLLESVDIEALTAVYAFLYPLFQEAYEDLGYPDAYFNDRLVEAIDNLLATPEPENPIKLVRPSVMFKYADPDLERLSAGQKILIRIGPDQARRVKERLKLVRREITRSEKVVEQAQVNRSE